jgi:hypothetical protein
MVSRGRLFLFFALAGASVVSIPGSVEADAGVQAPIVARYARNVPGAVRGAVDLAMALWSQRVESSVPIEVDVEWGGGLPSGVAAATEPVSYYQARPGGPLLAVALANAIAGFDHDPSSADVHLLLGDTINWYTGLDGAVPSSATDMVTMVLHELAHGLGFIGSFRGSDTNALRWGRVAEDQLTPVGLDVGLLDVATGSRLTDDRAFANPSSDLLAEATSGRVVWGLGARDSRGHLPVMYAPRGYEPHSSLVHFDDAAYPAGDPDSLMTSLIRRGESIHRVGPATLGVLADLGWTVHPEPAGAVASAPRHPLAATRAAAPATVVPAAAAPAAPVATTAVPPEAVAPVAAVIEPAPHQPSDSGRVGTEGVFVLVAIAAIGLVALQARRYAARLPSPAQSS